MKSPTDENKKRLLSGIKPTGRIHIGNYFGALKQFVDLQDEYDTFVMVANLHALTALPTKEAMIEDTKNLVLDYLGAGLDENKVTLFRQSDVPAHANLAWIFNNLVTVPYLMRAHAFKSHFNKDLDKRKETAEKIKNKYVFDALDPFDEDNKKSEIVDAFSDVNVGTFDYPVLMAADILLYDTDVVPVGKDQKQHIEYARDIAAKFNHHYGFDQFLKNETNGINFLEAGSILKSPTELIMESVATVPGTDGQKMSKSYNNTIPLFATDEEIHKAVMSIPTDSRRPEEEKNPDELILYQIHKLFDTSDELRARYAQGLGYGDAKKLLITDIVAFVTPMRERRKKYEQDPEMVEKILLHGAMRANEVAMKKLADVYEAVGLTK